MTTTTPTSTRIPTGTWSLDDAHSSATFAVQHAGLAIFRGGFKDLDAKLEGADDAVLTGTVKVESIDVEDENIRPHLLSPDFFDAERHPEVSFRSTELAIKGDEVTIAGELEIGGNAQSVDAAGTIRGPIEVTGIGDKLALALEAKIDRTEFGMDWQMELPGGTDALADDVTLSVDLELVKE